MLKSLIVAHRFFFRESYRYVLEGRQVSTWECLTFAGGMPRAYVVFMYMAFKDALKGIRYA